MHGIPVASKSSTFSPIKALNSSLDSRVILEFRKDTVFISIRGIGWQGVKLGRQILMANTLGKILLIQRVITMMVLYLIQKEPIH